MFLYLEDRLFDDVGFLDLSASRGGSDHIHDDLRLIDLSPLATCHAIQKGSNCTVGILRATNSRRLGVLLT
jgi:hypothetical protein